MPGSPARLPARLVVLAAAAATALTAALAGPAATGTSPGAGARSLIGTGTVSGVPLAAARRTLKVKVVRPAEAKRLVEVKVTGPRQPGARKPFKKTLRKTTRLRGLAPGVYRVRAKRIDLFDQRIEPTVTRRRVRIKDSTRQIVSEVRWADPVFCAASGSTAYGWGDNASGQLGSDGGADSVRPVVIPRLRGATAITGGLGSTYALCADGTVWSWGANTYGELGIGRTGNRAWPVEVPGLSDVVAIDAADNSAFALRADGSVWAWGIGRYGQLGDGLPAGPATASDTPVRVALPVPARAIAAGGHTAYAILADNRVMAWGNGEVGQLGNGATASSSTPVLVAGIADAASIAAGHANAYVATASGALVAWGVNGQREVPTTLAASGPNYPTPYVVPGLTVTGVGAGHSSGYAVGPGGLTSWGSGRFHDVGYNNGGSPAQPKVVTTVPVGSVAALAGAGYGSYLLTTTGEVWAWGDHNQGQVGHGAAPTGPAHTQGVDVPTRVLDLTAVTAIGAGSFNGYALR